jgi:hypothetical protein
VVDQPTTTSCPAPTAASCPATAASYPDPTSTPSIPCDPATAPCAGTVWQATAQHVGEPSAGGQPRRILPRRQASKLGCQSASS